jgi:voltage-gated potassium channel
MRRAGGHGRGSSGGGPAERAGLTMDEPRQPPQAVSLKEWTYLSLNSREHPGNRNVSLGLGVLIVGNVIALMIETVPHLSREWLAILDAFEYVSIGLFTLEYLARVWSITAAPKYHHPLWGRLRYLCSPMALVDLAVLVPAYLPFVTAIDLRSLRVMRLLRIVRLLRIPRYASALSRLARIVHEKRGELVVVGILIGILLIVFSTLIFYAENEAQPAVFSSIPASLWWAIVTLTTIGYGDAYPITVAGKMVAGTAALFGVAVFTLPAGIIAAGFIEENKKPSCMNCIKKYDI